MSNFTSENISREALYFEKLDDDKVKCLICGNECVLADGKIGRCKSRENVKGEMKLTTYAVVSSVAVDPIEKKPLYHFYPGTRVFSLGGWGCNFSCKHCQNWDISQPETINRKSYIISPEEAIRLAKHHKSDGICWTYNEPAIWFEYTLDSAKLAKEEGLYTAYVTNGFIKEEPLRELAPYLDAYRVDFKGFSDEFYKNLSGIKNWMTVYDNAILAKELGMHVEAVTNIVPGFNDSDEMLTNIAKFISKNLGVDTPWHVSRFFPNYKLNHIDQTPLETIEKAVKIGKEEGLNHIYRGNCPGESNTVCPSCGHVGIERHFTIKIDLGPNGTCKRCGQDLNVRI